VSLFERLIAFWARMWGLLPGLDERRLVPLGPPVRSPTVSADALIAEADARGATDAKSGMLNAWLFGGPDDPESEIFDPPYVRRLRSDRQTAISSLRAARLDTEERIAPARASRDEARGLMAAARARMSSMAMQEEQAEARAFAAMDPESSDPAAEPDPTADDGPTPWEGESTPLPLVWRLLILLGLVAAELPVQFYVFDYFLGPGGGSMAAWLAPTTGAIVVFGPFVAGTLSRTRAATGSDRRIGYVVLVLTACWLFAVIVLGLVRGRLFEARVGTAAVRVSAVTVVLMFVALLLVVGAMSLMLGLARRHPIQEAYVRSRARRDHFETLLRTTAVRLNPIYHDPTEREAGTPDPQEQAIIEAYVAAEHAYFAALCRTVGDPVFTEAVQHRRGLRATS
jgi:hypothetical protein